MNAAVLGMIRLYTILFRPIVTLFGTCRHYPSCSEYAAESVRKHGVVRGAARAFRRILRCQPFSKGGVDLP